MARRNDFDWLIRDSFSTFANSQAGIQSMKQKFTREMPPPIMSVVVPAYNVMTTIRETLESILNQTFQDFEIIVVDDGSTDETSTIVKSFSDKRMKLFSQSNRGLAGARNTGIHLAKGKYVAFCDSDDIWEPEKLDLHVEHLEGDVDLGISYCGSSLIDENGKFLKTSQRPKLKHVSAADIFKRNPIGNGSVAVFRRIALDAISYRPVRETERDWWFDETFKQSEDIDAWMRFALQSDWKIEGVQGLLTRYRVQPGGLSANLEKQFDTWCRMRDKVRDYAPRFAAKYAHVAESYQLRYLARRAFVMGHGTVAAKLARKALSKSIQPLLEEPIKTASTLFACEALNFICHMPKLKAKLSHIVENRI
jgi:glycosyltransferase involved in cell wall biosynthesis